MEKYYLLSFIFFTLSLIYLLIFFLVRINKERLRKKYLLELTQKFDDYTNLSKIAYIFADETQRELKAEFTAVIEYTYPKINILAEIPQKYSRKNVKSAHEVFLIIKNLLENDKKFINNQDIKSDELKKTFPLFDCKNYKIIPIYKDNYRILTLEIYKEKSSSIKNEENILKEIIKIFENAYKQQIKFDQEIAKTKKNEIIIKFLDRIRNTLDEKEIEKLILEEIGQAFNADRAYFILVPKNFSHIPIIGREYLGNPYAKSLLGNDLDAEAVWNQLRENKTNPPVFVIEYSNKFIEQNNLEGTPIETFIKKSQIKSSYPFLIFEDEINTIYLVIQYTKEAIILDKDDFEILEMLTKQTNIALTQAKLYTKLIKNSQKEKLLIDLISILRSSLDLKKVAKEFTSKVGEFFDADRCLIRFFDDKKNIFNNYNEEFEYKKHFYTPSSKNYNFSSEMEKFLLESEKFHDTISIQQEVEKGIENFQYQKVIQEYLKENRIKSYLVAFIRYNGKLLGILSLDFTKIKDFNKKDENFIKAVADQIGTAIYQSQLYYNVQNVAQKEKVLKEILSDTISMENKEEIYKYFSSKIIELFNAIGVIFINLPQNKNEQIKYFENYKVSNRNLAKFKKQEIILNMINSKELKYFRDLKKYENNKEFYEFLKETGTKCISTLPITEKSLLLMFFDTKKEFDTFEENLLFALTEIISKTIKDIIKTKEIKNLRETFLSTLAHDLQIPMIAERNAINYLISKIENYNDPITKEILLNLLETNNQIEDMLKILMSIYKYEAKKQTIYKENCNLVDIIEETLEKFKNDIEKKKIKINFEIGTEEKIFLGDLIEIRKAITILIKTAIKETNENGKITIIIDRIDKALRCCIITEGKGLNENIEKIIFERDMLAKNLEHRIGEGMDLYLAKLIINEHNGKIYIKNKEGTGCKFCIEIE